MDRARADLPRHDLLADRVGWLLPEHAVLTALIKAVIRAYRAWSTNTDPWSY